MRLEDRSEAGGEDRSPKEYLGDSVYAAVEFGSIRLTTENGYPNDPRNVIYLEPLVLKALFEYAHRLGWRVP